MNRTEQLRRAYATRRTAAPWWREFAQPATLENYCCAALFLAVVVFRFS